MASLLKTSEKVELQKVGCNNFIQGDKYMAIGDNEKGIPEEAKNFKAPEIPAGNISTEPRAREEEELLDMMGHPREKTPDGKYYHTDPYSGQG